MGPLLLDIYAKQLTNDRLAQAAQDALAAQLPRSPDQARPDVVARQLLASGLRALAARLDPCLAPEPSFVVARPR